MHKVEIYTVADTRGGRGGAMAPNNFNCNLHFKEWKHIVFILEAQLITKVKKEEQNQ